MRTPPRSIRFTAAPPRAPHRGPLPLTALALAAAAGCGSSPPENMGSIDMASAIATVDMAMKADPPDLAINPFVGTLLYQEVRGKILIESKGIIESDARLLSATLAFNDVRTVMHAGDTRDSMGLGCVADYYDLTDAAGKRPPLDVHMSTVRITGHTATQFQDQSATPGSIECAIRMGAYRCGWGPLVGGMPGDTLTARPFDPTATVLTVAQKVRFEGLAAGTSFGTFDVKAEIGHPLELTSDIGAFRHDLSADSVLRYTCPAETGGACGTSLVVATVITGSVPPYDNNFPGTRIGVISCTALANSGAITIPKTILAAGFGQNAALVQGVATTLSRAPLPDQKLTDTKGNSLRVIIGRGQFGLYEISQTD